MLEELIIIILIIAMILLFFRDDITYYVIRILSQFIPEINGEVPAILTTFYDFSFFFEERNEGFEKLYPKEI